MTVQGSLDVLQLPEVLQMLAEQRKTGILTVQGADDIVAVSFLAGRIVAADALNQTVEEGIGRILTERGWVTGEELRRLALASERGEGRLIDLLVSRGTLDRERLLEALRVQTFRLLLDLLGWSRGEFKFYGGEEVSYEEGIRPLAVDEVLLRAAEEESRREEHALPELDWHLKRRETSTRIQVRPLGEAPPEEASGIWLSPEEAALLQAIGSGRRLSEAAAAVGLVAERARYLMFDLVRRGLVEEVPEGGDPGGAPAAERPAAFDRAAPAPPAAPAPAPRPERAPVERPEPAAPERPAPARRRPAGQRESMVAGVLAAALVVALAGAAFLAPVRLLVPFPWQQEGRSDLVATQRAAALLALDRAAQLHFLREGRFPESLDRLVELGLVAPGDLTLPGGSHVAYTADETGYSVELLAGGETGDSRSLTRSIQGDFLLDPELVVPEGEPSSPPLVLLD